MVTMAQSTANWRNTHTQINRMRSLTHLHQLLFFSACWVFSCFRSPPNSDMDYRIFIVHTWSFLCMRVHTGVGHTDGESAHFSRKNSQILRVLLTGFKPSAFGSKSDSLPIEPPRYPRLWWHNYFLWWWILLEYKVKVEVEQVSDEHVAWLILCVCYFCCPHLLKNYVNIFSFNFDLFCLFNFN